MMPCLVYKFSSSSPPLLPTPSDLHFQIGLLDQEQHRNLSTMAAVKICVKANDANPSILGECPFCHRILLTLEEKNISYEMKLVDLKNKPEWFLEINPGGKVPVVNFGDGKWVSDSDVLATLIEEKYPEPSLKTPDEYASVGSKILFSFMKFLKSKVADDGSEQAYVADLADFNEHLKEHGPYVDGEHVSAVDLSLAPKLFHAQILLGHYKNWSIPENLTYLHEYMKLLFSRESFIKTKAPAENIIAAWGPMLK